MQNGLVFLVVELNIVQDNPAFDRRQGCGVAGVLEIRLCVEQSEEALTGGHRGLECVVAARELANRVKEPLHPDHEGGEHAGGHLVPQDQPATDADDQCGSEGADEIDAGEEVGSQLGGADIGVKVGAVEIFEMARVGLLAREALGHADAGDRLVEKAVDQRQPLAGGAIGLAHVAAKVVGQQDHQRQDGEGNQGQLPVQEQHGDYDADQDEGGPCQPGDRPGDEILKHAYIADQPAHQAANAVVIEEAHRQGMQMTEELTANVGYDAGAGIGHHCEAGAACNPLQRDRGQEEKCPETQCAQIAGADTFVNGPLDNPRRSYAQDRSCDDQ